MINSQIPATSPGEGVGRVCCNDGDLVDRAATARFVPTTTIWDFPTPPLVDEDAVCSIADHRRLESALTFAGDAIVLLPLLLSKEDPLGVFLLDPRYEKKRIDRTTLWHVM